MSDEVEQIEPDDDTISEEWVRLTGEPEIRGVGAHYGDVGGWLVDIFAQEFYRQDPLGVELRQRIQHALLAVEGVTGVYEHDNLGCHRHPRRPGADPRSRERRG